VVAGDELGGDEHAGLDQLGEFVGGEDWLGGGGRWGFSSMVEVGGVEVGAVELEVEVEVVDLEVGEVAGGVVIGSLVLGWAEDMSVEELRDWTVDRAARKAY